LDLGMHKRKWKSEGGHRVLTSCNI
jgi:hypothetical protein